MKSLKKASGITLIALVITIVVLIILATVSINMILDDNGIIGAAELAKDKYQNAAKEEQEELAYLYEELTETLNPNVDMVKSEDNQYVPVPKGYVASTIAGEKSVSTGFVIKKGTNGAAEDVNEFVWVPVSDESFNNMFITGSRDLSEETGVVSTGVKTEYYSNLRIRTGESFTLARPGDSSGVREPDLFTAMEYDDTYAIQAGFSNLVDMAQGFVDDYANMRESIKKYKGFYIGRYELTGTVNNPTVQSGAVLTAQGWHSFYKACRNVAKSGETVTSTMIWGCQWDETVNWLKNTKFKDNHAAVDTDSKTWGNFTNSDGNAAVQKDGTNAFGSPQETGFSKDYWSANNICDLAGNYYEWTQEATPEGRVCRGGCDSTGSDLPVSARFAFSPYHMSSWTGISTRVTLYINP